MLLANVIDVPDWTTAVSGLIGIGVGIDYALLVLTRFRAALNAGKDRHDAVVEAVTTAGRSVIIAGSTVVIAVLGLFLTGLPYMYGVAISASLAVLVVMLASITLLPALLSYLGPRVDRLRIPLLGRSLEDRRQTRNRPPPAGATPCSGGPGRRRSSPTAILLALAAPALGMRLGFPDAGNDQPDTMTRQAYDLISEGFGPGANGPLVIAAELPDPQRQGRRRRPRSTSCAATRASPTSPRPRFNSGGRRGDDHRDPDHLAAGRGDPRTGRATCAATIVPEALGGSGVNAQVGGVTAALEDQSDYITDRMPLFIAGVVGLSFLLLLVAFHSPLISLKAAVMNLLSVSAAYGVMTLVAQGGAVGELIGIDHEVPIAPVHAGDDVRDPLRALDGLRGLPDLADPRGVPEGRRHPPRGRRRPGEDGPGDHRGGGDHGRRLPRLRRLARSLPQALRDRPRGGDLPRRHRGPDGPGAGGDAAARAAATGGSRTGSSGSCRGSTSRTSRSVPREGPSRWPDWWSPSSSPSTG